MAPVLVSVAMVGAVLSCFYLGFFLGVAGNRLAWHLLVNPDRLLYAQRMAFAAGLLIVIVLPIGRVFAISYAAPSFDRDPPLVHIFAGRVSRSRIRWGVVSIQRSSLRTDERRPRSTSSATAGVAISDWR